MIINNLYDYSALRIRVHCTNWAGGASELAVMSRALWLLTLAVPVFAGESAVLSSGMLLHVDRHEESDGMVRLYRGESVTVMPRTFVTSFEPDAPLAPLAPPPV